MVSTIFISAFNFRSSLTTGFRLKRVENSIGVLPYTSVLFTSAPFSIKNKATLSYTLWGLYLPMFTSNY